MALDDESRKSFTYDDEELAEPTADDNSCEEQRTGQDLKTCLVLTKKSTLSE